MKAEHLKPLTAIRFFAAMWVVFYDLLPKLTANSPATIAHGYLGVDLFFILSGFILCHVYLPQIETGRYRYGTFLWARLARVYPLHLATLIAIGVMGVAALAMGVTITHPVLVWQDLPAQLLMVHAWGFAQKAAWNHASWSISAEWFAYLCFPLFAAAALRLRSRPALAVASSLVFLAAIYALYERLTGQSLTQATFAWGALRIIPAFAYGSALFLLWRSGAAQGRVLSTVGAVLALACVVLFTSFGAPDMLAVIASGALIFFLAGLSSSKSKLVQSPILIWLGEVSYAVYMVFVPWELAFDGLTSKLLHLEGDIMPFYVWIVMLLGVLPVAALAHHLVEKPARETMRRWARGLTVRGLGRTPA